MTASHPTRSISGAAVKVRNGAGRAVPSANLSDYRQLAQVPLTDPHIPVLGQLPPTELPRGDALEPASEGLTKPLGIDLP
jgi:hypothetical protein